MYRIMYVGINEEGRIGEYIIVFYVWMIDIKIVRYCKVLFKFISLLF